MHFNPRNDLKDQRIPASSWKHCKHIFSLDEVERGFFLDRFQLGKTTIQRKLYCTTKGLLEFATIVHLFLCLKFLRAKKPVLGLPRSIPEIRPMRVLVIIITRKGLRLNSNTNQRPSSKPALMEGRFVTAVTRGFFSFRSSRSRIRRSIFATNNR